MKNFRRVRHFSLCLVLILSFCTLSQQNLTAKANANTVKKTDNTHNKITSSSLNSLNNISTYRLNYSKYKLVKGKSFPLKVTRLPSNYRVTYRSNNNVATVNSRGMVTGVKYGTAKITATVRYNNLVLRRLTCNVTVGPSAISVVIPESSMTLSVSERKDLNPIIKPKNSTETPRFSSSNPKVVSVTSAGIIKGLKKGTAVITVTIGNNKTDNCFVTVMNKPSQKNIAKNSKTRK